MVHGHVSCLKAAVEWMIAIFIAAICGCLYVVFGEEFDRMF